MIRRTVAVLTAAALAAIAAPAPADDGSLPPMPPLPREPIGPDFGYDNYPHHLEREGWLEDCRAEYSDEYSEEEHIDECGPYAPPYGMGYDHRRPAPAYRYGHGYPGKGFPVMWVPVKIKTRYVYSEPLRREKKVVVEEWVADEALERKTLSRPRKASKAVPVGEGKTTRSK
jgi:hypothetical protein